MLSRKEVITLVPTGGLCNRMRSIASAINMSNDLGKDLEVIWLVDPSLNCQFDYLFKAIPCIKLIQPSKITKPFYFDKESLSGMIHNRIKRHLFVIASLAYRFYKKHDLVISNPDIYKLKSSSIIDKIALSRRAFISTNKDFYKQFKRNDYSVFMPIDSLMEMIDHVTANFTETTIGLHIRRGDHKKSMLNSPLSLFETVIAQEIRRNSNVKFYLASDSKKEKQHLKRIFGSHITTNFDSGDRSSVKGMQAALIDLYALSRTCKIYGSYWSSFSATAAGISGIELIRVTDLDIRNVFENNYSNHD